MWTRTSEANLPVLLGGLPAGGGLHQAPLKEGEARESGGRGRRSKALLPLRWGLSRGSGSRHLDEGLVEEQRQLHSRLSANTSCGRVLSLFLVFLKAMNVHSTQFQRYVKITMPGCLLSCPPDTHFLSGETIMRFSCSYSAACVTV